MPGIAARTAELLLHLEGSLSLPCVDAVVLPPVETNPCKDAEFALVVLGDGSVGAFYTWNDSASPGLVPDLRQAFRGRSACEFLKDIDHSEDDRRAFASGVLNALSQSVMKRAGLKLEASTSLGGMCFDSGDQVGLVGLFPSLVRQFLGAGVDFVVIERKQALLDPEAGYEISLDPARLKDCNKVLITGSTLLNRSLDEVLHHCRHASRVAVIGPTASCLPDRAFAAGVHAMGGIVVRDLPSLLERQGNGAGWGDAVDKYLLDADSYPGFELLVERLQGGE